jgi:hypothetical protein
MSAAKLHANETPVPVLPMRSRHGHAQHFALLRAEIVEAKHKSPMSSFHDKQLDRRQLIG